MKMKRKNGLLETRSLSNITTHANPEWTEWAYLAYPYHHSSPFHDWYENKYIHFTTSILLLCYTLQIYKSIGRGVHVY